VMAELRVVKAGLIDPAHIKEKLASKANAVDMARLVRALEKAMGGRIEDEGEAAAVQIKCLVCDKPVTSISRSPVSQQSHVQYTAPSTFYDKGDDGLARGSRSRGRLQGSSMTDELHSRSNANTAESLEVLSHIIDLPLLGPASSGSEKYRQRVRANAGGGVGTFYQLDTR
jgi:hypothetical protein